MAILMASSRLKSTIVPLCVIFLVFFSLYSWSPHRYKVKEFTPETGRLVSTSGHPVPPTANRAKESAAIIREAEEVAATPITAPYKYKFDHMGQLTSRAREWVKFLDAAPPSEDVHALHKAIEDALSTMFPFIANPPKYPESPSPFQKLREGIDSGSRGLVIPTGKSTMRYAAHLIRSLQEVLDTQLPIMIVYAGDQDFPPEDREKMQSRFQNVEFMDILAVMDDATVQLGDGGWAIKAFAALYAPYEQVILADADCVFVQPPELLYRDPSYIETGTLLFHDRLLSQNAYRERHDWRQSQIKNPSAALNRSLAWTGNYAEEGDSGVFVLDKSRLDVLMGLLHIAWQNTKAVRDEITSSLTYGDKESWWFGLELSGVNYAFEKHYGAMVGWPRSESGKEGTVCSFYVGHVDSEDSLVWYNGGLLVNKSFDSKTFGLPTHLVVDGTWHSGSDRREESCMDGGHALELSEETHQLLKHSVTMAKELDTELGFE